MIYTFDEKDAAMTKHMLTKIFAKDFYVIQEYDGGYTYTFLFKIGNQPPKESISIETACFLVIPQMLGFSQVMYSPENIKAWMNTLYREFIMKEQTSSGSKNSLICQRNEADQIV